MTGTPSACQQTDLVYGFAVGALTAKEANDFASHLATCTTCRGELNTLRPVIASFIGWPSDVLRPSVSLWDRISARIAAEPGRAALEPGSLISSRRFAWKEVTPGIECKVLATDPAADRVSMLVRLAPGMEYPAHRHAGFEELHLLNGELMIDDRKLAPGDYYRAEAGSVDTRVWSATGCTCVLMTSLQDELR